MLFLCSYCCCLSVLRSTPAVVYNHHYCLNSFRPAISWRFGRAELREYDGLSSAWLLAPGVVRQRYLEWSVVVAVAAAAAAGVRVVGVVEQPGCLLWVVAVVVVGVVAVAVAGLAG